MPFIANVIKVFIASPSDVPAERREIRNAVLAWNDEHAAAEKRVLLPVAWETHAAPTLDERPQASINRHVLDDCDLLIAAFWTRIGTPTSAAESGTVEEIRRHLDGGKPSMLYFSSAPVAPDSLDPDQYARLKAFRDEMRDKGLIETYSSGDEFREKVRRQLMIMVRRHFGAGSTDATAPQPPSVRELSSDAKTLLQMGAEWVHGMLVFGRSMGGGGRVAAGEKMRTADTARDLAALEGALEELEGAGLIAQFGNHEGTYRLTDDGYAVADDLKKPK